MSIPAPVRLAVHATGSGPSVLLVHGSAADHRDWDGVVSCLQTFRCHAVDRRGRGASGDSEPYTLAAEAEDLVTVARQLEPTMLVGHSYGAVVAMEAARRLGGCTLVLYEPPLVDAEGAAGLAALADAMDAEPDERERLELFLAQAAGATNEELEAMRQDPSWPHMLATTHTLAREARAIAAHRPLPRSVRATFLLGDQSAPVFRAAVQTVAAPGSTIRWLAGQGHNALLAAPRLVAGEIRRAWRSEHAPEAVTDNLTP